jgi:hypothetical protein
VKANQVQSKDQLKALDQAEAKGYSDGAYKNEPEGCGRYARPFGSIVDDALACRRALEPDG